VLSIKENLDYAEIKEVILNTQVVVLAEGKDAISDELVYAERKEVSEKGFCRENGDT
jgi:hypothetical protein